MPSLVQISDLHRSKAEPIDNDTLLASIVADLDRFSAANEAPEALIVSGDLVQGAALGTSEFTREMKAQYEVAFDFIDRLCNEIVQGDRSKVVVVPGNHDVCWNTSLASMTLVAAEEYPDNLKQELARSRSPYRWSWKNQKLYRVTSEETYARRIDPYWEAVEGFYEGVDLPLPIDRRRGYHLFSLFAGRALVAGFESTHRNDHLRYEAELLTGVASRVALHLRNQGLAPDLLLAVWHHSVHGAPSQEDYLNIEAIKEMAGLGFQMGFHGHQHLAENTDLSVGVSGGASMCLVSGGSLCADWQDLPRGVNRQYNIVAFDQRLERGTLHVREMVEGNQFSAKSGGRFMGGSVPLAWSARDKTPGAKRPSDDAIATLTVAVEEANRKRLPTPATLELMALRPARGTYPRVVALKGLQISSNWPEIIREFDPPSTADEAIAVAEAAFQSGDTDTLGRILNGEFLPVAVRGDFTTRLDYLKFRGTKK